MVHLRARLQRRSVAGGDLEGVEGRADFRVALGQRHRVLLPQNLSTIDEIKHTVLLLPPT